MGSQFPGKHWSLCNVSLKLCVVHIYTKITDFSIVSDMPNFPPDNLYPEHMHYAHHTRGLVWEKYDSITNHYNTHTCHCVVDTFLHIQKEKAWEIQWWQCFLSFFLFFYFSPALFHLSWCLSNLIKTLWWVGGGVVICISMACFSTLVCVLK